MIIRHETRHETADPTQDGTPYAQQDGVASVASRRASWAGVDGRLVDRIARAATRRADRAAARAERRVVRQERAAG